MIAMRCFLRAVVPTGLLSLSIPSGMQGLPIHHTQAVDMHRCSKVTFADVFGWVPWRKQLICMLANAEEEVSKLKATKKYGMKNQQLWWNGHTFFFLAAIVAWYLGFCFATELTVMCVIR